MHNSAPNAPLDGFAIAISGLCALHCLMLPVLLSISPMLGDSLFGSEDFHRWLLVLVVPVSAFALGGGYRRHRDHRIWAPAIVGLSLLMLSAVAGVPVLGELGEQIVTVLGGTVLAFAHGFNFYASSLRTATH